MPKGKNKIGEDKIVTDENKIEENNNEENKIEENSDEENKDSLLLDDDVSKDKTSEIAFPSAREIEEKMPKKTKKNTTLKIAVLSVALCLVAVYLLGVLYFKSHFFFRTYIDNIPVSGNSITTANNTMITNANGYELSIVERNNVTEKIKGSDIGLKYDFSSKIEELVKAQNPFLWVNHIFVTNKYNIYDNVSYDEMLLKKVVAELKCFNPDNIQEPVNASINYNGSGYEIVEEVKGNKIDDEKFNSKIIDAIKTVKSNLNLDDKKCYIDPSYTKDTIAVINAKNKLDKYIASKITYNINGSQEVIDKDLINTWINIDEKFNVNFDTDKIKEYINSLGDKYDNIGEVRNLTRITGEPIKVSKKSDITYIDRNSTLDNLTSNIESGKEVTEELTLKTPTVTDDYVINTFVEVDLSNQHVYFYKNGNLIVDGSCVTGNVNAGNGTPAGVFTLTYKERNAVLRGPGYASPVSFWMPFNGGIGLHDASWRSNFGGQIYMSNGSHGCVNLPYSIAKTIYENLDSKTTIICTN